MRSATRKTGFAGIIALLGARLLACAAASPAAGNDAADGASSDQDARVSDGSPVVVGPDASADGALPSDGGPDADGGFPLALASVLAKHASLAAPPGACTVDGQRAFVYLQASGPNARILSIDLPTGAPIKRVDATPYGFAVHDGTLYMGRGGAILTAPTDGGAPVALPGPAADGTYNFLAWDDVRQVFVWQSDGAGSARFGSMAADGTAFTQLASSSPGPGLFPGVAPRQEVVAYDGTSVFFRDKAAGGAGSTIVRLDLFGTQAAVVLATAPYIGALAVDATGVVFRVGTKLNRVPIAGGSVTTLAMLPAPANQATPLADSTYVYESGGSDLFRVPLAGGSPEIILRGGPAGDYDVYPLCQNSSYLLVGTRGSSGYAIHVLAK